MPFKKGQSGNVNGRPSGSKNKLGMELRDQIIQIAKDLDKEGKGLRHCGRANPQWFYEHFIKPIIPKDIMVEASGDLNVNIIQFAGPMSDNDNPTE